MARRRCSNAASARAKPLAQTAGDAFPEETSGTGCCARTQDEIEDLSSKQWGTLTVDVVRHRGAGARRSASFHGRSLVMEPTERVRGIHEMQADRQEIIFLVRTRDWHL